MNLSEQIAEKIESLKNSLLAQHPTMPTLLREIHKTLKDNPDQVTILSEEQVGVIVNGLKRQTATEIATTAVKAKGKSLKNIAITDL